MENVDLNAPAFGPNAQKIDSAKSVEVPEATVEETAVESTAVQQEVQPTSESAEEPERVKYSRFKKVYDRAIEAEREAAEWRARAESVASRAEPEREAVSDTPSWWRELYGDSEASNKAWRIQEQAQQQLIEEARQQALEAVQSERQQESVRIRENENTIDESLDALSAYIGRDLSEREQSAVLDIVDEYTPKDDDGNYLGATIPFEKAWDIYELKTQASKAPRQEARDRVAALTGSRTQGEPSVDAEKDKNWNPLDWNAWKKRLQQ